MMLNTNKNKNDSYLEVVSKPKRSTKKRETPTHKIEPEQPSDTIYTVGGLMQLYRENLPLYAASVLKLVTKKGNLEDFNFNPQQKMLHEKIEAQKKISGKVRVIVLKSRKLGISTYTASRFLKQVMFHKHHRAFVMTHNSDGTSSLFKVYQRFYNNLPDFLKPILKKSNAKELEFEGIDSSIRVGTAGSAQTGRGDTFHYFHASEIGFWDNGYEIAAGAMSAVADVEGTEIIIESTPNGIGNIFFDMWTDAVNGENGYEAIYIPWTVDPDCANPVPSDFQMSDEEKEYALEWALTPEQTFWRRTQLKLLGAEKFVSEYSISAAEAFRSTSNDSFITPESVVKARHRKLPAESKDMPLILGVDVAAQGKDKTCIVWRRGNTVEKYVKLTKLANDEVADYLIPIINNDVPAKVFIDGTGGYGGGVVSCLRMRGYQTEEIHFSSSPIDPQYANKRAEMYGDLREWLKGEVSLPDIDEVEQDLTDFGYKHNSSGRLQLESKNEVKARMKRSPDLGDAIALTFAYPLGPVWMNGSNNVWSKIKGMAMDYSW